MPRASSPGRSCGSSSFSSPAPLSASSRCLRDSHSAPPARMRLPPVRGTAFRTVWGRTGSGGRAVFGWRGSPLSRHHRRKELVEPADELRAFDLACVLEQLASAVLLVACDGRVLLANERARSLFDDGELVGRRLSELPRRLLDRSGRPLSPEQWPLPRALQAGEAVVVPEVELERVDGTVLTVSVSA